MDTGFPENDYATPERLAIYLEIGWSDYLLPERAASDANAQLPYPNPLADNVQPEFPRAVAGLARDWSEEISLNARSFCDFGGATGRTVHEIDRQFPGLEHLAHVEPSATFCEWARRLLASEDALPEVPVVGRKAEPLRVKPKGRPAPLERAGERLRFCNETLETHDPRQPYDLATCLNVVDRHPDPASVIGHFERCLNPGGLLVMACPFDFDKGSTPNPAAWIDDLNSLFEGRDGWEHIGESELYYEFRGFNRSWTRFSTQVVGKRLRTRA